MMEIQYLITLKAVVKTGSFTAAGNELGTRSLPSRIRCDNLKMHLV